MLQERLHASCASKQNKLEASTADLRKQLMYSWTGLWCWPSEAEVAQILNIYFRIYQAAVNRLQLPLPGT